MTTRHVLFGAVSAAALFAAAPAWAQTAPAPTPRDGAPEQAGQDDTAEVDAVVVTGTRVVGRTRLDTVSPVDVISDDALAQQGTSTELAQALSALAPSINFPRPAITDGSDHVRPVTLRGLAPDQALVLVNGVRGHVGALVAVNGSIGRGSTAFDLNTIPTISLGQVEVLREGASAQYGADAIAGVVNLRLREARSGGSASLNFGVYNTDVQTARGARNEEDGRTVSVAGWQGLPLGAEGFLTVSGEYVMRDPTNRSDFANPTAVNSGSRRTVSGRFGDPEVKSLTGFANAGLPLGGGWEAYGVAGYQARDSEAAATQRPFNDARNVPAIYPNGFLPIIATEIQDLTLIGGLKGEAGGFALDLSISYGSNALDYQVLNSLNTSFGANSQRTFDAGGLSYDQFLLGADASRAYEVGLVEPLNVAVGVEYRREGFEVTPGEPASYTRGPFAGAPVSQGFPGFRPSNASDVSRDSIGAYVDVEGKLTQALTASVAARYENYSDFGSTTTGKLSARYDFSDAFALRGAVSTGFKAPALQQQFFSYTSTNAVTTVVNGVPVTNLIEAGNFRVTDAPAIALGAKPLEPEDSVNLSAGLVYRQGPFELTVDAYEIKIDNRIVLSETLGVATPSTTPAAIAAIQAILAPFGVSGARFFVNGVDTTTRGLDVVGRYRANTENSGRFIFTAALNLNSTSVDRVPPLTAQQPQPLFDRGQRLTYEEGTPEQKMVLSAEWEFGNFGATLRGTGYDSVLQANNNVAADYETGDAVLIDLEGRYQLTRGLRFAAGVNNLGDEYPTFTPATINNPTGSIGFPGYSPFGFNGRFLYARLSYDW
jgi:iron complex outermembrane receptor protein